jgi:Mg2+/Co2+ transporter CorB
MYYNENIPKEKEILNFGKYSYTILKTTRNRIETVDVRVLEK